LQGLAAGAPIDPIACPKCGGRYARPSGTRAHARAVALQTRLIAGKKVGALVLPAVGKIEWATMMAVADMLLSIVWATSSTERRERLFDRVAREQELSGEDRIALSHGSNYASLLMLDWLVVDLPQQLARAVGILRPAQFEGLPAHEDAVDADMAARLRLILSPAIMAPRICRGAWHPWIDSLRESARELLDRANRERFQYRRQRLTAFAELKGGATVLDAAAKVCAQPRSIYRWLDRGVEYGLEAVLERRIVQDLGSGQSSRTAPRHRSGMNT
jgi:hypothetical protein